MIVRMFSPRQLQIVEKKVKSERKREYEMTRNVQTKTDATPVFFDIVTFVPSKRTRRFVIGALEGTKVTHDDIRARLID